MKKNLFFLILLISCQKDKIPITKDSLLIEEFIYDHEGVVFKITNDIDSAYNYLEKCNISIDSIALRKFHNPAYLDYFGNGWTWFTKKGQYVCWRDKYTSNDLGYNGFKWMDLVFPNKIRKISQDRFCVYGISIDCNESVSSLPAFKNIFPVPYQDTVFVKLSNLAPNSIWK
jgi:hypothetical protein